MTVIKAFDEGVQAWQTVVVGKQGPQGEPGVVAADAPITYDAGTQTVGIDSAGYVASVNSSTGTVTLDAAAVGALGTAATTDVITEGTTNLYTRVPTGGAAGEVLVKQSATDYDLGYEVRHASWTPVSGATYRQTFTLNAAATLDRVLYTALLLPSTTSLSNIVAQVQVEGVAGSVVRLGIYLPDAGGAPGALLVDAGTASATTTGLKSISISQTVSGMIYVAVVVQGAVATLAGYRITGASYFTPTAGSFPFTNGLFYIESGVSGALPATANATLSGGTQNGYCAGVVVA